MSNEVECRQCKGTGIDPDLGTDTRPEVDCRNCEGIGMIDPEEYAFRACRRLIAADDYNTDIERHGCETDATQVRYLEILNGAIAAARMYMEAIADQRAERDKRK